MSDLQPFHVRPQLADELVLGVGCMLTIRRLMKAAGGSSGLGIALKSMLQSSQVVVCLGYNRSDQLSRPGLVLELFPCS